MRVPQVSERIKEAPAQALRGVFAGIGQLLLISDKLRNKAPADVPRAGTPGASETASAATVSEPTGQPKQPAEPARATQGPAGTAASRATGSEPTSGRAATSRIGAPRASPSLVTPSLVSPSLVSTSRAV